MQLYNGQINAERNINYYMNNLVSSFENHYKKIESYKENIRKIIPDYDKYKIYLIFIIEDSSIFGTIYYKDEPKLLLPVFIKEFNDYFKNKDTVDLILKRKRRINKWI